MTRFHAPMSTIPTKNIICRFPSHCVFISRWAFASRRVFASRCALLGWVLLRRARRNCCIMSSFLSRIVASSHLIIALPCLIIASHLVMSLRRNPSYFCFRERKRDSSRRHNRSYVSTYFNRESWIGSRGKSKSNNEWRPLGWDLSFYKGGWKDSLGNCHCIALLRTRMTIKIACDRHQYSRLFWPHGAHNPPKLVHTVLQSRVCVSLGRHYKCQIIPHRSERISVDLFGKTALIKLERHAVT